jgi:hypothetical protein
MPLKEILRPTKEKVILAILIPIVYFAFLIAANTGFRQAFLATDAITQTIGFLASMLLGALIYYPLACGSVFLYRRFSGEEAPKEQKGEKAAISRKDMAYAIVLIAIFNPFTFTLAAYAYNYTVLNVLNYPCGVEVLGYMQDSPARDAMLVTGEVISMADGQKVDTTDSLLHILSGKSPGDTIIVQTNMRAYIINLTDDINGRAIMGVITTNFYCPRGQPVNQSSQFSVPQAAMNACVASCVHTRDAGDGMESGPCLLDPIPVEPDWVCDIAHSPRQGTDNLPENQCSFYLSGNSTHFIELTPECVLINAV